MSDDKNPPKNQNEKLTDHNYDGIQELDNSLPRWWLMSLYLTIIFAGAYYAYYELGTGPSLKQEFAEDVANMEAAKGTGPKSHFPQLDELAAFVKDPAKVALGKSSFQTHCVSCHGDRGQGLIGPNLTDDYWLHGDGKPVSIAKTIHDGVLDKGMPPWGALLSDDEIYALTAYVKSLHGSNPAGAKAPQGPLVKD